MTVILNRAVEVGAGVARSGSEFAGTYKIGVVPIPTNKPMIREDQPDLVYTTVEAKLDAYLSMGSSKTPSNSRSSGTLIVSVLREAGVAPNPERTYTMFTMSRTLPS